MKTPLTLAITALLTLSACGGSGDSKHVEDPKKPADDTTPPAAATFSGFSEENSGGKLVALASDDLYIVEINGAPVMIDSKMKFPSDAEDIAVTGIESAAGLGGAIFSKGLLHYATFGALADYDMAGGHYLYNYRAFYHGQPTQAMPNAGKATYSGRVIQQQIGDKKTGKADKPWIDTAKGTLTASADFANKTVAIELDNVRNPAAIAEAQIIGNTFSGAENNVTWHGGFFGDNAAEMAGIALSKEWSAAYGGVKK